MPEIGDGFNGVVLSPPGEVPRNTLYITPFVGLASQVSAAQCVPVPDKLIVMGEFVASLVMVTLAPFTAPPVVGANVTFSFSVCPVPTTVPFDIPLALNPAPVTVTAEIVISEFPLFAR